MLKQIDDLAREVSVLRREVVLIAKKTEAPASRVAILEMAALKQRTVIALWERGMRGKALCDVVDLSRARVGAIIQDESRRRAREIAKQDRIARAALLPDADKIENKSIDHYDLSIRTMNCLANTNISTIGQLASKTVPDMLKTKNFGRKSLKELQALLASLGMSFADEPAP